MVLVHTGANVPVKLQTPGYPYNEQNPRSFPLSNFDFDTSVVYVDGGVVSQWIEPVNHVRLGLNSFCTAGIPFPDMEVYSEMKIPETIIPMNRHAYILTGLICEPFCRYYSYGPVTKYHGRYTSCVHAAISALITRQLFSAYAKYGQGKATDKSIKPIFDFVKENFDKIFQQYQNLVPYDPTEWYHTQRAKQKEIHDRSINTAMCEYVMYKKNKPEYLFDVKLPKFKRSYSNKIFESTGFSKLEIINGKTHNKSHNRLVQASNVLFNFLVGPGTYSISKWLSKLFGNPSDGFPSFSHKYFIYASGMTRAQIGHKLYNIIEDFGGIENVDIIEADEGRHDFHQSSAIQKMMRYIFLRLIDHWDEDIYKELIREWLDNRVQESAGRTFDGIKWRVVATMRSGDPHTTAANTLTIILKVLYSIQLLINKGVKNPKICAFHLGDDNYIISQKSYTKRFIDCLKQTSEMLRFDTDILQNPFCYSAFCSATFVPCIYKGGSSYYLLPRLGKILSRTYFDKINWSSVHARQYCKEISLGFVHDFACVPVFRKFFEKLVDICNVSVTSKSVTNALEKRFKWKKFLADDDTPQPDPFIDDWIRHKYFWNDKDFIDWENIIDSMTQPFVVLDAPCIDKLYAVDVAGVTSLDGLHQFYVDMCTHNIKENPLQAYEHEKLDILDKIKVDVEGNSISYKTFIQDRNKYRLLADESTR